MTVVTLVSVVADRRNYRKWLPRGMRVFDAHGTVTGDATGGSMDVRYRFNPDSSNDFQVFISVHKISVTSTVVDPLEGRGLLMQDQWERASAGFDVPTHLIVTSATIATTTFTALNAEIYYLGRCLKALPAEWRVQFRNVDTSVLNVSITGIISDFPFVPQQDWRI